MSALEPALWPARSAAGALEALAREAGLSRDDAGLPCASVGLTEAALGPWLLEAATWLGVEAEAVHTQLAELEQTLERSAPAIWLCARGPAEAPALALVLAADSGSLQLLASDGERVRLPTRVLAQRLRSPVIARAERVVADSLSAAGAATQGARAALSSALLAAAEIQGGILLRLPPSAAGGDQLRRLGVLRQLVVLSALHLVIFGTGIAGWAALGKGALDGHFDAGWLSAWLLLLLTPLPLRGLEAWLHARLGLSLGALIKQRLLAGALACDVSALRRRGAGDLLARVLESEALETLITTGGVTALLALSEVLLLPWLLWHAAYGGVLSCTFGAWLGLIAFGWYRIYRRRCAWTDSRLALTQGLLERMAGHRTRLVQQPPALWHDAEDLALVAYDAASRRADAVIVSVGQCLGRGFLVVCVSLLLASLLQSGPAHPTALAVGLGAALIANQSLTRLSSGVAALVDAAIAWRSVRTLLGKAGEAERPGVMPSVAGERRADAVLEAREIGFVHEQRARGVLRGCSLSVRPGDRVLLEGASGSGKSTFSAILTGLREPSSGLLLLGGLDRRSLGATAWHRRAAAAPAFHDNHVLQGTLAMNLLLGRAWPPSDESLREAEALCVELGLGELLERMPAGLQQPIGEAGWQLSHGERTRLFLARALLQRADVVVLDESFSALDPQNLERAARTVFAHSKACVVVAHP